MKQIWDFAKELYAAYTEDNALRLGAALAYYTIFSIAPIIVVIIAVTGFFFGQEAVSGEVYGQLEGLVGAEAALQIQELVKNSYRSNDSVWATILGIGTLIFAATGLFNELQSSLNQIWEIKAKPKNSILNFIFTRILSFGMVLSIGFVLLVSLVINSLIIAFSDQITNLLSVSMTYIIEIINFIISLLLTAFLFGAIYKILPDANVKWRDVIAGGIFTSILFSLGKYAIGFYLGNSSVTTTFGAAGSVVILLLWTYYTSQILFIGAEFTYVYAKRRGATITPSKYAVKVERKEIEKPTEPVIT